MDTSAPIVKYYVIANERAPDKLLLVTLLVLKVVENDSVSVRNLAHGCRWFGVHIRRRPIPLDQDAIPRQNVVTWQAHRLVDGDAAVASIRLKAAVYDQILSDNQGIRARCANAVSAHIVDVEPHEANVMRASDDRDRVPSSRARSLGKFKAV
jgi:hypothetical protein